jgi:large subunit ribosomal protein L18
MNTNLKKLQRNRRQARIRAKVFGTPIQPRLAVFKSNMHISAQLIDDTKGITLVGFHSKAISKGTKMNKAHEVGLFIAKKAKELSIAKVVFDRGGFMYTGIIKAVAEGAREGGLNF